MDTPALTLKNRQRINKTVIAMTVTVITAFVLLFVFMHIYGVRCDDMVDIDRYTVSTKLTNGTAGYYTTGEFDALNKGDVARISVNIPVGISGEVPTPALYFYAYNCAVKVFDDNDLVFESGWLDEAGTVPEAFIGNRDYVIPLITDAYNMSGNIITVELHAVTNKAISEFDAFIVPENEAWKVPILNNQAFFVILMGTVILSALMTVYCIIRSFFNQNLDNGIAIFLMMFSTSVWCLGNKRMLRLLIQDVNIRSRAEYYSLYLLAVAIALLSVGFYRKGIFHKIWIGILGLSSIYFVTVIVLRIASNRFSPQSMTRVFLVFLVIEISAFVLGLYINKDVRSCTSTTVLRIGCILIILLASLEIGRYQLVFFTSSPAIANFQIGLYAVIVLSIVMTLYYVVSNLENQTTIIERTQLEAIAFKDTLTHIPNRNFFNRKLDEMEKDEQREYTLVFIDMNDLKKANDNYGHSMGDNLIIAVAECMTEAFAKDGIYCRWGGDEFAALIPGSKQLGEDCVKAFDSCVERLNEMGGFPFPVTVAHGEIHSSSRNYVNPNLAIREADYKMYETKKKMKAEATTI